MAEPGFDLDSPFNFLAFVERLFTSDFMPHGHCYFWRPDILWLHTGSDAIISLAYFSITFFLFYLIKKRTDIPFNFIIFMFGAFIFLCGATHLVSIYTTWIPHYRFEGIVKLITAIVSIATAILIIPVFPKWLSFPNMKNALDSLQNKSAELEIANKDLERFNRSAMGREKRIIELKNEVNTLAVKLGIEPPYQQNLGDTNE